MLSNQVAKEGLLFVLIGELHAKYQILTKGNWKTK